MALADYGHSVVSGLAHVLSKIADTEIVVSNSSSVAQPVDPWSITRCAVYTAAGEQMNDYADWNEWGFEMIPKLIVLSTR